MVWSIFIHIDFALKKMQDVVDLILIVEVVVGARGTHYVEIECVQKDVPGFDSIIHVANRVTPTIWLGQHIIIKFK